MRAAEISTAMGRTMPRRIAPSLDFAAINSAALARLTKHEANQQRSLEAFMAKKAEFDALLAELTQASDGHFNADPEAVLWGETAWLADATAKLKEVADAHFRRGEYAA